MAASLKASKEFTAQMHKNKVKFEAMQNKDHVEPEPEPELEPELKLMSMLKNYLAINIMLTLILTLTLAVTLNLKNHLTKNAPDGRTGPTLNVE